MAFLFDDDVIEVFLRPTSRCVRTRTSCVSNASTIGVEDARFGDVFDEFVWTSIAVHLVFTR